MRADSAYAGQLVYRARGFLDITLRTVSRPKGAKGFIVNARRSARDYERLPQHSEAHLNRSLITLMTRRLTRKPARWTKKLPAADGVT
ncbi:hypothetical protein [Streptomyces erythrochromogenes]|uniref:hypothetical protein n=1 Tax=Streptomyces erythrochromogenes TaxID=285574 RepID=UPI00367A2997